LKTKRNPILIQIKVVITSMSLGVHGEGKIDRDEAGVKSSLINHVNEYTIASRRERKIKTKHAEVREAVDKNTKTSAIKAGVGGTGMLIRNNRTEKSAS
jgi:hypothetical protein